MKPLKYVGISVGVVIAVFTVLIAASFLMPTTTVMDGCFEDMDFMEELSLTE